MLLSLCCCCHCFWCGDGNRYTLLEILQMLLNHNLNCQISALRAAAVAIDPRRPCPSGSCRVMLDNQHGFVGGIFAELPSLRTRGFEAALHALVLDPSVQVRGHTKALGEFAFLTLMRYLGNSSVRVCVCVGLHVDCAGSPKEPLIRAFGTCV